MFCPYCGAQNPDGAAQCQSCGAPLAAAQQPVQPPYQQPQQQSYQQPYQQPVQPYQQPPVQQPYQQPYQQPVQPPYQQPYQQPFQQPRKKRFGLSRIIIIILVLILIFVVFKKCSGGRKSDMKSGTNSGVGSSLLELGAAGELPVCVGGTTFVFL